MLKAKLFFAAAMGIAMSAGNKIRSYWGAKGQSKSYFRLTGIRYKPHQGKQECERRMRNVKRGLETAKIHF